MTSEEAARPNVWVPVSFAALTVGVVVARDWSVHENVSVASVFTAHHPDEIRYSVHLATLVVLCLLIVAKPKRRAPGWVAGLVLVAVNTLATSRVVMTMNEDPHAAVAGFELKRAHVGRHSGRYAHFVCFETFLHDSRSVMIDGVALTPPFLPLPVDWGELENMDNFTCVGES